MITFRHTLLAFVALVAAGAARAGSNSAQLTINATVASSCTIKGDTIGVTYDAAPDTGTFAADGHITVQCTKGTKYSISLGNGGNWDGSARHLANTADAAVLLPYELYSDANGTTAWDATTVKDAMSTSRGAVPYLVHVVIPAAQDVPVGSYTDKVDATVNF